MVDSELLHDVESDNDDDVPHAFLCGVCLDLLYKPIVLSCGHISCFWCVHKSMSGFRESRCPICRSPYYHFPTICEMLHLLILKMYPVAYKKREKQILEEERELGHFSPQLDFLVCGSQADGKMEHSSANGEMNTNTKNDNFVAEHSEDSANGEMNTNTKNDNVVVEHSEDSANGEMNTNSKNDNDVAEHSEDSANGKMNTNTKNENVVAEHSENSTNGEMNKNSKNDNDVAEHSQDSANGEMNTNTKNDKVVAELILEENSEVVRPLSAESLDSLQDLHDLKTQNQEKISVADVLCRACTQLLIRPVVLNCGHAFCESCIKSQVEILKCQVCQSLQPRGFLNVCLELDQFLKEQFSKEYSLRSVSVQLELAKVFEKESPTSCSNEGSKKGEGLPIWGEVASKVHPGFGCDSCGMYPIIGDRYKCEDCFEEVGFDLCGDCYNTRSKRPGRFNQQHRPEHKFKLISPKMFSNLRLGRVTEMLLYGSRTFVVANDEGGLESSDGMSVILELSSNARGSDNDGVILELSSNARESDNNGDDSDVDGRTQTNSNDDRTDQNHSQST